MLPKKFTLTCGEQSLSSHQQDVLKLADFGSCRSVYCRPPHTEYISTRWYRAPECLLTDGYYSHKMDVWSAGCVFFEILRYLQANLWTPILTFALLTN